MSSKNLKRFKASLIPVTVAGGLVLDGDQHEVHLCEAEPGEKTRKGEVRQQSRAPAHSDGGPGAVLGSAPGGHHPLGRGRASQSDNPAGSLAWRRESCGGKKLSSTVL